jgi:hypothetical protein
MKMSNSSNGFANSARLVLGNIGMAGTKLEELIAGFNPDAAIQVGREERTHLLRIAAEKLAEQQQGLGLKQKELDAVNADLKIKKTAAGKVTELSKSGGTMPSDTAVANLVQSLKAQNARAVLLETDIASRKTAIDFLQHLVDQRADALRSFDSEAENAKRRLEMAKLREEEANLTAEIQGMAKQGASVVGLSAISLLADKAERNATAAEILNGATGDPLLNDDVMASILNESKEGGPKKSPLAELEEFSK